MDVIEQISVEENRIVNPRTRNRMKWLSIVASIKAVGLKKPISVSRRESPDECGRQYDLICGQGRLEAHIELEQSTIAAVIVDVPEADRQLMSLVENFARRQSSNKSIYFEVRSLLERGYNGHTIAKKLGVERTHIHGVVRLVQQGEAWLTEKVEAGKLPISVAVEIASGNDGNIQKAMLEAYATGEIRGSKLQAVRKLIKQQKEKREGKKATPEKPLTGVALANLYKQRVREQQRLVVKADQTKERLLMISTVMRELLADEDLITLLRAENIHDMPEQLAIRAR